MPPTRRLPAGAPIWIDLGTSDLDRSIDFYTQLFGWTADVQDQAQYGGYVLFSKNGQQVAGAMAKQPGDTSGDGWTVYFKTDDIDTTIDEIHAHGGGVLVPAMQVTDRGHMAIVGDSGHAMFGLWEPIVHQGFAIMDEPGAPVWFEQYALDYEAATDFYPEVFGIGTMIASDSPEFRYTVFRDVDSGAEVAGVMDARNEGVDAPFWITYFTVDDVDASVEKAVNLGATLVDRPEDSTHGRLAQIIDPTGSPLKLVSR